MGRISRSAMSKFGDYRPSSALLLVGILALSACTAPTGAPSPSSGSSSIQDSPAARSEAAWNELAAAARAEGGKLVVKGNPVPEIRTDMPRLFKERFGIELEYLGTTSQEFAIQAEKERAVGLYTVDVVHGGAAVMYPTIYGAGWLDPLPPLMTHPDSLDASKWPNGKFWWMDPEQQYILRISNYVNQTVHINTNLIKPGEITSWYDLLKPEYRGKIIMNDPIAQGGGHLISTILHMKFGEDYVRRLLIDQRPLFVRDDRQQGDSLARGAYAISLGMSLDAYQSLVDDGLPINFVGDMKEFSGYLTAGWAMMGLMNQAPHPAAAKLYVNWVTSRDGMEWLTKTANILPVRSDIDQSKYPSYLLPVPGREYIDSYDYDFAVNQRLPLGDKIRALLR